MTIVAEDDNTQVGVAAEIADAPSVPVGLTGAEADRRRQTFGPNAMRMQARTLSGERLKSWSPVPWMLEGAIALELVMGKFFEATVIGVLLFFNAGLSCFQEGPGASDPCRLEIAACDHGVGSTRPDLETRSPLPILCRRLSEVVAGRTGSRGRENSIG